MKSRMCSVVSANNPAHVKCAPCRGLHMGLASFNLAALVFLLLIAVAPVWGQVLPGFLEGPMTDVDVINRTARVNGVLMHIPVGIPMASPTVDLNELAVALGIDPIELLQGASLPGRITPGFTGGTCLCATEVDPLTGIVTATGMTLEPSENVILASVTSHNCITSSCDPDDNPLNELRVAGILVDANSDARLLSDPVTNRGFEVNLMLGNLVGVGAGAEGYFGITDNHLHFYVVELDGGVLVNAGMTEVSIMRARCRARGDRGDWAVLGATHDPGTGTVTLRRGDTGDILGTASVIVDTADPNFGAYLFSEEVTGTCSDSIIADFGIASVTEDVDIRNVLALPPVPGTTVLQPRPLGNGLPVTINDTLTTTVNTELTFGGLFLLDNDSDPDVGDTLTLISVATTSAAGGTVSNNLDGTFTFTPAPGFSGVDTFTYTIADGYIPSVNGSVNVTVETPLVENLIVQKATFRTDKGEWRIRGTSSIVGPGNSVTIYLGSTVGGPAIGEAPVDALGDWDFREQNSQFTPGLESTVSVISTAGGIVEGVPLSIK